MQRCLREFVLHQRCDHLQQQAHQAQQLFALPDALQGRFHGAAAGQCVLKIRLHVADAAKVLGSEKAGHCSLFCPTSPGVYTLDAIAVAKALKKVFPQEDISLIGADVCYVHRIKARGKDFLRPVRTAAALLILLLGSALGLTWFHADVNMPQAQADVYAAITGAPPDDVRLITIPYCVGVALGVCVFYAIPFPHQTTPLEVKLTEYQEDMEKAEGKPIE